MTTFRIEFDWVDAGRSSDRMSSVTMADLGIMLGESSVTAHIDRSTRAYRDRLTAPLFPIAEWVVTNWWALRFEYDLAGSGTPRPGFEERHDLVYAGSGFLYPRLEITSLDDLVQLSSTSWRARHAAIEFPGECAEVVDRVQVEHEFSRLVDAVLDRLAEFDITDTPVERDWTAIRSADPETVAFCAASAALGLDPFDLDDRTAQSVERLWSGFEESLRSDLLSCADLEHGEDLVAWARSGREKLERLPNGDAWSELRNRIRVPASKRPWDLGYALARQVRQLTGAPEGPFEFTGDWDIRSLEDEPPTVRVDALVSSESPACLTRGRSPIATRFLQARALGDYVARPSSQPSLLTTLATHRQQMTRAFAAEFLAPSASITAELGSLAGSRIGPEVVETVSRKLRVSEFVIRHQIDNHELGTLTDV